jgi:pyrophosphate--fructose-6-phosphate 1-phosphotransferase
LGYEGRCAAPSNFDSNYCYALGVTASNLILCGKSAYIAFVGNITKSCEQQIAGGVPLTKLLDLVYRNGEEQAVIHRTLVNLNGLPFKKFEANRDNWAIETAFVYPGPIQFFGPDEICNQPTKSLALEHSKD